MGDISPHFSRKDFACACGCGFNEPHPALVAGLEALRSLAQSPITITGPLRCRKRNATTPGAAKTGSYHQPQFDGSGWAADIRIAGLDTATAMYRLAEQIDVFHGGGIGLYHEDGHRPRIHVDVRGRMARWAKWNKLDMNVPEFREREAALAHGEDERIIT